MNKKQMPVFAAAMGIILMFVVIFVAQRTHHRSGTIVLPQRQTESGESDTQAGGSDAFNEVRVTPSTVQLAISTLSRPSVYSRTQTVETFWSGGSGSQSYSVAVSSGKTRIDHQLSDGGVCHMLVSGNQAAVWYDEETTWTMLRAEQFSADIAQRMPTYETVVSPPGASITTADYRDLDGSGCIYVETAADEAGYHDAYWVSVDSGLLVRAERFCRGELVYRFTASDVSAEQPEESLFRLPDGSRWESGNKS